MTDSNRLTSRETVFVIPPYPHAWWRREEIQEGVLVTLGWPDGDGRIFRVTGIWDGGASLKQETAH